MVMWQLMIGFRLGLGIAKISALNRVISRVGLGLGFEFSGFYFLVSFTVMCSQRPLNYICLPYRSPGSPALVITITPALTLILLISLLMLLTVIIVIAKSIW